MITQLETIRFYCFNNKCSRSIFHSESCDCTEVFFMDALCETVNCAYCDTPMVSNSIIRMDRQIKQLLEVDEHQIAKPIVPVIKDGEKLKALGHIMLDIKADIRSYNKLRSDFNLLCDNLQKAKQMRSAILEKIRN